MKVTLTNANTAYPAPSRTVNASGTLQRFTHCVITNGAAIVSCGASSGIIGGAAPTVGLPIAANAAAFVIPTTVPLYFASGTAGAIVDYEYF